MRPLPALDSLSRADLVTLVVALHANAEQLEARVLELEARLKKGGPPTSMPGTKPQSPPDRPPKPRKPRPISFVRHRAAPTEVVVHAPDRCPDCGVRLLGGWIQRRREVIDVPPPTARIIEHQFVARTCPLCRKRVTAPARELDERCVGKQRYSARLVSLLATLREVGRLPVETVQWLVQTVYGLKVSLGAVVAASARVAEHGAEAVTTIKQTIRTSPVVHADETGWRENGGNGYVWSVSTPTEVAFTRGSRASPMLTAAIGEDFAGTLVSDFYVVYRQYDGLHQWCWAHLLRDLHELKRLHPDHPEGIAWATSVKASYDDARAEPLPTIWQRDAVVGRYQDRLLALCAPVVGQAAAPHRVLAERLTTHIGGLFTFVGDPRVPSTNNAAERSLRHLVVSRKIGGGTRSPVGSDTKMALATLFGTWRLRGLDPLTQALSVLLSPQP